MNIVFCLEKIKHQAREPGLYKRVFARKKILIKLI